MTCFFACLLLLHNHNILDKRGSFAKFGETHESTTIVATVSFKQLSIQLMTQVRAFKMCIGFYPSPLK